MTKNKYFMKRSKIYANKSNVAKKIIRRGKPSDCISAKCRNNKSLRTNKKMNKTTKMKKVIKKKTIIKEMIKINLRENKENKMMVLLMI